MKWSTWTGMVATLAEISVSFGQGTTVFVGISYCPPSETVPLPLPTNGPLAPYYLSVVLGPNEPARYLNGAGDLVDIWMAAQFILTESGQLKVGQDYVSANLNVPFQVFRTSTQLDTLSTTFSSWMGVLRWRNGEFPADDASFYRINNTVVVAFDSISPDGGQPVSLELVSVTSLFNQSFLASIVSTQPTTDTRGPVLATQTTASTTPRTNSMLTSRNSSTSSSILSIGSTSTMSNDSTSVTTSTTNIVSRTSSTTIDSSLSASTSTSSSVADTTDGTVTIESTFISTSETTAPTNSEDATTNGNDGNPIFTTTTLTGSQELTTIDTTSEVAPTSTTTANEFIITSVESTTGTNLSTAPIETTTTTEVTTSTPEDLTTRTIDPTTADTSSSVFASTSTTTSTSMTTTTVTSSLGTCSPLPLASSICPDQDRTTISLGSDSTCYGVLCSVSLVGTIITSNSTVANSLRACAGYCSVYNVAIPYGCLGVNFLGATIAAGQNNCLLYTQIAEENTAPDGVDSVRLIYQEYPTVQKRGL